MAGTAVFHCQACRARLELRCDGDGADAPRAGPLLSALDAAGGGIDESFIVLDSARRGGGGADSDAPGLSPLLLPGAGAPVATPGAAAPGGGAAGSCAAGAPPRSLDESFVVLGVTAPALRPPGAGGQQPGAGPSGRGADGGRAGLQAGGPTVPGAVGGAAAAAAGGGGSGGAPGSGGTAPPDGSGRGGGGAAAAAAAAAAAGFDAKLSSLRALFELASSATGVDHPLCLDCAVQLKEEVEGQIRAARQEVSSYAKALAELEAEALEPLSEAEFQRQLAALRAEEGASLAAAGELEAQLAVARRHAGALAAAGADAAALEERFWHGANDYAALLGAHVDERDALLARIEASSARLSLLKATNVVNDVFRIWHDGPFGTINGCRLGRTPEVPVEWDEINAAWGQAVLLLHTMAQACQLTFSVYRLLPMGSHPRVADRRGAYDLFGPVSKLWAQSYDRAMAMYLACLREYGDYARARDITEGRSPPFEFPFPIDGDKVGNYSVKLFMQTKDAKWTKALKLMLADLKVGLQWMVRRDARGRGAPTLPGLSPEGPAGLAA